MSKASRLPRIALVAMSFVLAAGSVVMLRQAVIAAPLVRLASKLEAEEAAVDLDFLQNYENSFPVQSALDVCDRALVRAHVSVSLYALDIALATGNPDATGYRLARAQVLLQRALRCFPANGNFWLRLAMIKEAMGAPQADVLETLRTSYRTAPFEGSVLRVRIPFASRLASGGMTDLLPAIGNDVRTIVEQGSPRVVAELVGESSPMTADLYSGALQKLSDERRRIIDAEQKKLRESKAQRGKNS